MKTVRDLRACTLRRLAIEGGNRGNDASTTAPRDVPSLLLGVAAAALFAAAASAGKPAQTGTVLFWYAHHLNTMNASGSGKTPLPDGVQGEPSTALHGGHRWFLEVRDIPGERYPDDCSMARREIFAARDDGEQSFTRQLTDQADLETGYPLRYYLRWMPDDAGISWVARRWMGGVVVEGGLYSAAIDFDSEGNVVGLAMQPWSPSVEAPLVTTEWEPSCQGLVPDMWHHDWAPGGNQVVFERSQGALSIGTVSPPDITSLATSWPAGSPRWSPDGTRVVYLRKAAGGGIVTISPAGEDEQLVISTNQHGPADHVGSPSWSPDGASILYHRYGNPIADDRSDVYRAKANGSGKVNLTKDLDTRNYSGNPAWPIAWR